MMSGLVIIVLYIYIYIYIYINIYIYIYIYRLDARLDSPRISRDKGLNAGLGPQAFGFLSTPCAGRGVKYLEIGERIQPNFSNIKSIFSQIGVSLRSKLKHSKVFIL